MIPQVADFLIQRAAQRVLHLRLGIPVKRFTERGRLWFVGLGFGLIAGVPEGTVRQVRLLWRLVFFAVQRLTESDVFFAHNSVPREGGVKYGVHVRTPRHLRAGFRRVISQ